jgi:6-hydroxycyclohex-1-ene-1-carbonyl-CoA dehydrogenase
MQATAWMVRSLGEPMTRERLELAPGADEVTIAVAGCGVCHTDLGFYYEGVPTRRALPLALGHEISGRVVAGGRGAEAWLGRAVIVPAVIPCGECRACRAGRGAICPRQIFPGNDVHGGFATHVCVPARGLCAVPDLSDRGANPQGVDLATLSVVADAVSTPYQAILRSGLGAKDVAVFVGAGGVGGFGVQIAAARGAAVVAIDVEPGRLERLRTFGAGLTLNARELAPKELKRAVREFAERHDAPTWRTFVFETSGTARGQETAFALLGHGGYLGVVGYTADKVELRLSNLMALDATAQGNWGCLPEHYPAVVALVLAGAVRVAPFVEQRPLASINDTFAELHAQRVERRVILVPES